jgi:hypothetical protein
MLLQLMDGEAHSARALATVAGVAPSTASSHLRRLCDAGLVIATDAGRRRLHRLAGPEVAQLVEALAALAPPRLPDRLQPSPPAGPLLRARACYGHLAGKLGIDLAAVLCKDGVVDGLAPGETGVVRTFDHPLLTALGVDELPSSGPADEHASTGPTARPTSRVHWARRCSRPCSTRAGYAVALAAGHCGQRKRAEYDSANSGSTDGSQPPEAHTPDERSGAAPTRPVLAAPQVRPAGPRQPPGRSRGSQRRRYTPSTPPQPVGSGSVNSDPPTASREQPRRRGSPTIQQARPPPRAVVPTLGRMWTTPASHLRKTRTVRTGR